MTKRRVLATITDVPASGEMDKTPPVVFGLRFFVASRERDEDARQQAPRLLSWVSL